MTIATILPNGKTCFYDQNGVPLVGGSVFFYIPNTSTPKNTWQDSGEITLNTNPVILDSLGSALIYGSGQYRQVVRDVNNNLIWDALTQDLIGLFSPQTSPTNGTALIGFLQPGGVARTLYSKLLDLTFSVKDFGAVGDGATDDTAAIQAALTALTSTPATLYFPAGSYRITAPLSVTFNYGGDRATTRPSIRGDGPGNTQILWDGPNTPSVFMFTINRTESSDGPGLHAYSSIGGFSLAPIDGSKNYYVGGLDLQKWAYLHIHDIFVSYCQVGIQLDQVISSEIEMINASYNQYGIISIGAPSSSLSSIYANNALTYISCEIGNNVIGGLKSTDGSFVMMGGAIEGNAQGAPAGTGFGAYITTASGEIGSAIACNFQTVYFEGNGVTGNPGTNPGLADIWINHVDPNDNISYRASACFFSRISTNYASYGIYVNKVSSTECGLNVCNNVFTNYAGYSSSSLRKYIQLNDAGGGLGDVNIDATGNYYNQSTEEPDFITGAAYRPGTIPGYVHIKSYGATVYCSSGQSIPNGVLTAVNLDTAIVNDASIWTSGSRLVVPAGVIRVRLNAGIRYALPSIANVNIAARILKNGAAFAGGAYSGVPTLVNIAPALSLSTGIIPVNGGDYFELWTSQATGGNLALDTAITGDNWLSLQIIE